MHRAKVTVVNIKHITISPQISNQSIEIADISAIPMSEQMEIKQEIDEGFK